MPVLVDSRYRLLDYRGLTACTPNESEVEQVLGVTHRRRSRGARARGPALLQRTAHAGGARSRAAAAAWRCSSRGRPTTHIPIFGSDEVADVTGAGDTVIATFGLALAAGASFYEAARLANYAGGLVVMKRGTATVSARELGDAIVDRSRHGDARTGRRKGPPQGRRV